MAKAQTQPKKAERGRREAHPAVVEMNDFAAKQLAENKLYQTAIIATKRAIRVVPNSRELWSNIGTYFFNTQQYAEAEAAYLRAIAIDQKYSVAHVNLALVYGATHYYDKAMEYYELAEQLDPSYLGVKWNRSLLRLKIGDYKNGFEEYETRIPFNKNKGKLVYPPQPPPWYKHEQLMGKNVYDFGEQGYVVTIKFSILLSSL